jgi:hypothetical protein
MVKGLFATLLLAAGVGAGVGASAQGFSISGSFTGIANADVLPLGSEPPRPESYYDGAAVNGTFELVVPAAQYQTGGSEFAYFLNPGGLLSLHYTIRDESFSFVVSSADPTAGVILLQSPSTPGAFQTATFLTDFTPKYNGASFELSGPPGSLFDGLDATTLHQPSSPPLFGTHFASSTAQMSVDIDVADVRFGGVTPVAEPATYAMFVAGLAMLAGWGRGRPARAPVRVTSE